MEGAQQVEDESVNSRVFRFARPVTDEFLGKLAGAAEVQGRLLVVAGLEGGRTQVRVANRREEPQIRNRPTAAASTSRSSSRAASCSSAARSGCPVWR